MLLRCAMGEINRRRGAVIAGLWRALRHAAWHSRLLHFVILGSIIFALAPQTSLHSPIHIDSAAIAALTADDAQRRSAAGMTPSSRDDVLARTIQDELLYREALRLGLDQHDGIIRERLIQKILFLAEDMGGAGQEPTEERLRAYFDATRSKWWREPMVQLVHVYGHSPEQLVALTPALVTWRAHAAANAIPPMGASFPLSRRITASIAELAVQYGQSFADAVKTLPVHHWSTPIASKYGFHVVWLDERSEAQLADYEDVADDIKLDYLIAQRQAATAALINHALARTPVYVDTQRIETLDGPTRLAFRTASSGED